MKTEYKRDLQNNYLILEVSEAEAEDGYGLRMAEQNQVKGLLPMHESRRDGKLYLHYEITSRQTLESVYEKKVMSYQDILAVLSGMRDTLEDMRKYLLSPQKLLFAPEMIYVSPKKKELQLCYYAKEDEYPITMLAEFILKRLDHRDRQAVTLGYGFFQQANSANFSLTGALRDIFAGIRMTEEPAAANVSADGSRVSAATAALGNDTSSVGRSETWSSSFVQNSGMDRNRGAVRSSESIWGSGSIPGSCTGETGEWNACPKSGINRDMEEEYLNDVRGIDEDEIPVTHRERKKQKTRPDLADRLFQRIHPAVLLSFLLLLIGLELVFAFEILGLTETGGCFFLILTVEMLINHRLLREDQDSREMPKWEDDENEDYEKIMQEVYRQESCVMPETVEETRCLIPDEREEELHLVCAKSEAGTDGEHRLQDIHPGTDPVYIGKMKGEADVILHAPTVSRMHARIQIREGKCFLKDMNSKNGTFVNGERLTPQEEREVKEGDTVSFADMEYHVIKY